MSLSSFFENLNNDGTCSGGEEVSYMRETKIHHVCTTFGCKGGRGRGSKVPFWSWNQCIKHIRCMYHSLANKDFENVYSMHNPLKVKMEKSLQNNFEKSLMNSAFQNTWEEGWG